MGKQKNDNEKDSTISELDLENEENLDIQLKKIKKQEIANYFKLNTFRITMLAMLASINIILAIFSFYVLGIFPIFTDYLKLEITFVSYLLIWLCINGFYAIVMITPLTWLRSTFLPSEPIGLFALNLSDLATLVAFIVIMYLLKKFINRHDTKSMLMKIGLAAFCCIIFASIWNIFTNFTFIFRLYGIPNDWNWTMATIIFGFNSIKFSINFILFILIYKPVELVITQYKTKL